MKNVFEIQNLTIHPEALQVLSVGDVQRAVDLHQQGRCYSVSDVTVESTFSNEMGVRYLVKTDFDKDETYIGTKCDFDSLVGKKVFLVNAAVTDCGKEIPADTLCEVLICKPDYLLVQAFLVDRCYTFYVENGAHSIRLPVVTVVECEACGEEIEVEMLQADSAKQEEFHYCTDCEESHNSSGIYSEACM